MADIYVPTQKLTFPDGHESNRQKHRNSSLLKQGCLHLGYPVIEQDRNNFDCFPPWLSQSLNGTVSTLNMWKTEYAFSQEDIESWGCHLTKVSEKNLPSCFHYQSMKGLDGKLLPKKTEPTNILRTRSLCVVKIYFQILLPILCNGHIFSTCSSLYNSTFQDDIG